MDYRSAGVDVQAGRAFVERIRSSVQGTHRPEVLGGVGGFAGLCRLPGGLEHPLLVAGTDGVGTKLELAQRLNRHDGIGLDLVAMCVNDVITSGAEPLFFLDYIATGRLTPDTLAEVVEGIAHGCRLSGCALLGGETAEMPGFYHPGQYDLAGFCVGVVEESRLIDGRAVKVGDRVVGVASSGVHSNGFSLVRRILEDRQVTEETRLGADGPLLLKELLTPTTLYGDLVKALMASNLAPHGMAHITGGGLPENLPRCLPDGVNAALDPGSWERPALFRWLQEEGDVLEADLWHTFNLGVGFCLVVTPQAVDAVLQVCKSCGHRAWEIGQIQEGTKGERARLMKGFISA
ncbi:MAG: phosphoribosylformylglycinamidine cyclo-ligase [Cyanobium sp.]